MLARVLVPTVVLVALALLVVLGGLRIFAGYPRRAALRVLGPRDAALVEAAAEAVFPEGGAVPFSGPQAGVTAWVDRYLQELPRASRRLMGLLFLLVEQATLVFPAPGRGGRRRFSALSLPQRQAVLEGWRTSRLFPRRLVFTSLRAILTMGYFADPRVLRTLGLAPFDLRTPVREADLLYPPVGRGPEAIRHRPEDVDWTGETRPLGPDAPLHPAFAGEGRS